VEYIMFLDESGDHNLANIDPGFPVFCLTGCIFEHDYYHQFVRQKVDDFKQHWFGTTEVILLSRDIRKHQGAFTFLGNESRREEFYNALNGLLSGLAFTIVAVVILKRTHLQEYGGRARHPYHLSLAFIMERYSMMLRRRAANNTGYIIAESRNPNDDRLLKDEFQRVRHQGTFYQSDLANITTMWMEKKKANIIGLQIADLAAYPIAAQVLRPDVPHKSFLVLRPKIDAAPEHKGRKILGYGLKIFPQPSFEHLEYLEQKTEGEP